MCNPDADRTNQLLGFTLRFIKVLILPTSDVQKAQAGLLRLIVGVRNATFFKNDKWVSGQSLFVFSSLSAEARGSKT